MILINKNIKNGQIIRAIINNKNYTNKKEQKMF